LQSGATILRSPDWWIAELQNWYAPPGLGKMLSLLNHQSTLASDSLGRMAGDCATGEVNRAQLDERMQAQLLNSLFDLSSQSTRYRSDPEYTKSTGFFVTYTSLSKTFWLRRADQLSATVGANCQKNCNTALPHGSSDSGARNHAHQCHPLLWAGASPRLSPMLKHLLLCNYSGEVFGWASLVRGVACETAIASIETLCLTLTSRFLCLLEEPRVSLLFATIAQN